MSETHNFLLAVGCPECGAAIGEECNDPDENHSARIHEFIENAGYQERLTAHLETLRGLASHGVHLDERESLYLTDPEIIALYGSLPPDAQVWYDTHNTN